MDPISPGEAASAEDVVASLVRAVRAQRGELTRLARGEGLGPEDAVDCVQDAFCTFLHLAVRGALPPADAHAAYLAGVVRNAARNKRRRHHLARPHDAEAAAEAALDAPSAESLVERAEEHVRLRACVEQLCDTQRAVVTLRLLEERGGEDVAASLGVSRGYVDVLLHRAKARLLACMTDDDADDRDAGHAASA